MTQGPTDADLTPGRVMAGRFRLERLLGKGGMGSVWVAHHLNLNIEVALKFIDASVAQRDDVASRFAQEAMAAAKVKSPHVVNILDYGTDAFGRPYIAMELLQGEELAQRLERWGRLPLADVCRVVVHACRGLGRAHAAGVVHRDLKPENLFLVDDDEGFVAKVLDFGIAKASSPVGTVTHHTGTGQILGTPLFMSPEQALGRSDVDFRSDLYSLAVVAFRCLTGSVPFATEALGELIVRVSTEPVPSARALRPELPPAVDVWFQRAMHKDPAQRFGSAREMAEMFLQACDLASGAYAGSAPPPASSLSKLEAARPSGPATAAAARGLGTLVGATANYTPPTVRPWVSYGAAAAFGGVLFGLLLLFKPFGGDDAPPPRERALPQAQSAGSASGQGAPAASPSPAPAPPKASAGGGEPAPEATAAPSAPTEGSKGDADVKRDEPAAEGGARRRAPRPAPSPARPPSSRPAQNAPKSGTTDWGIE